MFCIPTSASLALLQLQDCEDFLLYILFSWIHKAIQKKVLICIWQAKILNQDWIFLLGYGKNVSLIVSKLCKYKNGMYYFQTLFYAQNHYVFLRENFTSHQSELWTSPFGKLEKRNVDMFNFLPPYDDVRYVCTLRSFNQKFSGCSDLLYPHLREAALNSIPFTCFM